MPEFRSSLILLNAVQNGDLDTLTALHKQGYSIDDGDFYGGVSPLFLAAIGNHFDCVEFLIRAGARTEHSFGSDAGTLLMHCAGRGLTQMCTHLLKLGAKVDGTNMHRRTALMVCASKGDCDVARILLKAKANVEHTDGFAYTPLIIAARAGHADMIALLVEHGANIHHRCNHQRRALEWTLEEPSKPNAYALLESIELARTLPQTIHHQPNTTKVAL